MNALYQEDLLLYYLFYENILFAGLLTHACSLIGVNVNAIRCLISVDKREMLALSRLSQ